MANAESGTFQGKPVQRLRASPLKKGMRRGGQSVNKSCFGFIHARFISQNGLLPESASNSTRFRTHWPSDRLLGCSLFPFWNSSGPRRRYLLFTLTESSSLMLRSSTSPRYWRSRWQGIPFESVGEGNTVQPVGLDVRTQNRNLDLNVVKFHIIGTIYRG